MDDLKLFYIKNKTKKMTTLVQCNFCSKYILGTFIFFHIPSCYYQMCVNNQVTPMCMCVICKGQKIHAMNNDDLMVLPSISTILEKIEDEDTCSESFNKSVAISKIKKIKTYICDVKNKCKSLNH